MATERPSLLPVLGPDGLARDAPVITYTEKVNRPLRFPHPVLSSSLLLLLTFSPGFNPKRPGRRINVVFLFMVLHDGIFMLGSLVQIIEEEQLQLKR